MTYELGLCFFMIVFIHADPEINSPSSYLSFLHILLEHEVVWA